MTLNDTEIIKVLEICLNKSGGCTSAKCPLVNDLHCKELLISRCFEIINRQQEEIDLFANIGKLYSEVRSEAVREFVEKLKREKFCRLTEYGEGGWAAERLAVKVDDIDNLVSEMFPKQKGEENA